VDILQRLKNVLLSGQELNDAQLKEGARQDYPFSPPSEPTESPEKKIIERSTGQTVFEVLAGLLMIFVGGMILLMVGLPGIVVATAVLFNIQSVVGGYPIGEKLLVFFGGIFMFIAACLLIRHGIKVISGESQR
jgi:hypothetical protein